MDGGGKRCIFGSMAGGFLRGDLDQGLGRGASFLVPLGVHCTMRCSMFTALAPFLAQLWHHFWHDVLLLLLPISAILGVASWGCKWGMGHMAHGMDMGRSANLAYPLWSVLCGHFHCALVC